MTREDKNQAIDILAQKVADANVFYLADTSDLTADQVSNLRRRCHKGEVKLEVVKNTLLKKAFEKVEGRDLSSFYDLLKGQTSLMISEKGNEPAKVIKEFRKKGDKPLLKGAFVEEAIYIGDENLDALVSIKSKEEMIGEIIGLLQSPAKNVISGLKSGGGKIAGILKTLSEK